MTPPSKDAAALARPAVAAGPHAPPAVRRARRAPLDWLAAAQWAVTLALCAFLIVPVAMSVLAGLTVNYFRGPSSGLTLRWLGEVWAQYHGSVFLSLEVALATLAVTLVAGVPAGYALARSRSRVSRLIEEALVLPVALPGLASALALLSVYGGFAAFRTSLWFIVVGHVVFTLPFMVRAVAAVAARADLRTLEEGAASLGASFATRFATIVLPNLSRRSCCRTCARASSPARSRCSRCRSANSTSRGCSTRPTRRRCLSASPIRTRHCASKSAARTRSCSC
nr:ABC transporter permease subunit [Burkholderia pseudomallei]